VEMEQAAKAFLVALSDEQKAKASFAFGAAYDAPAAAKAPPVATSNPALPPPDERRNWHFIPRPRRGLAIKDMTTEQRLLAHGLLATGLSHRGYTKAVSIMSLESVLAILEKDRRGGAVRDPELYFFSIFGTPGKEPWGWRVEGHHLSLNFTAAGGVAPSVTPSFFGTNPGEVMEGPRKGTRILGVEEDLGRTLVKSLDEAQRKKAVILAEAPKEIANVPGRNDSKPEGIAWGDLTDAQRETLRALLREYLFRNRPDVAADELKKVSKKIDGLHFAWAGGFERGEPHYYRVQGGNFVLEYDNVQNGANHVHCVWRDFDHDFGADLLAEHYKASHAK
ncbi:MAG: DUF3500 domain-containing protein, partial [Chthoniobacteraceae bacterium]